MTNEMEKEMGLRVSPICFVYIVDEFILLLVPLPCRSYRLGG